MGQHRLDNKKGFVTLASVILLLFIAVAVFTSILTVNIDSFKGVEALREGLRAKTLANSCVEIALDKLKLDNAYAGNETIQIAPNDQCEILSISGVGNNNRVLRTIGRTDGFVRKIEVSITEINPNIIISNWQEKEF